MADTRPDKRTIRQWRLDRGWSQTELSVILHVTVNTVQAWEANRAEPKLPQVQRIMDAFGVGWDQIEWPVKTKKYDRAA